MPAAFILHLRSVACILAECLTRAVLFPGTESLVQFAAIVSRIGWPSDEYMARVPAGMNEWIAQYRNEPVGRVDQLVSASAEFTELLIALLQYGMYVKLI